jgi:hypothetical protein
MIVAPGMPGHMLRTVLTHMPQLSSVMPASLLVHAVPECQPLPPLPVLPAGPGPKAAPALAALISFFALSAFVQGLRAEL